MASCRHSLNTTKRSPFFYFKTKTKIIRFMKMVYVWFLLLFRTVDDLLNAGVVPKWYQIMVQPNVTGPHVLDQGPLVLAL